MQKLKIPSDKYKLEWCSIIENECEEYTCALCSHAIEFEQQEQEVDYKSVYTFDTKNKRGITVEVNRHNSVLKCKSIDEARKSIGIDDDIKNYTKIIGSLDQEVIDTEYPHYNIILKKIKLKPCVETYYLKNFPLITVHGDVVIVTAPKIED